MAESRRWLAGLTPRGWYHIRWLHLNRPQLILWRQNYQRIRELKEATGNPIFGHFLVIDGRMAGTWRRDFQKDTVTITLKRFAPLTEAEEEAVHAAAEGYGKFVGLSVSLKHA